MNADVTKDLCLETDVKDPTVVCLEINAEVTKDVCLINVEVTKDVSL
jgi:hypothetical protein